MNIFVTNKCVKHCSFCFNTRMTNDEPTFEQLKILIDNLHKESPVKFLGGEPSLHTNFLDLLRYSQSTNRQIKLFTNLLTSHEIWKKVARFAVIDCNPNQLCLIVNSTELFGDRQNIYRKNIDLFKDYSTVQIIFSYTIGENFDASYVDFDYLNKVLKKDNYSLRLSGQMPFPGTKSIVINNKGIGDKFIEFIECIDLDDKTIKSKIYFDCIVLPCWFSVENWKKYSNLLRRANHFCRNSPFDVFITKNKCYAIYALCCQDINCDMDISNSIDLEVVYNNLNNKYHELEIESGIPSICKECKHLGKECGSSCLAIKRQIIHYNQNQAIK